MITVIDNALEDPLFQSILDIVNHNDFPWYLGNDIDDTNKFNKGTQTKQLIHLLFSNIKNWGNDKDINISSPHADYIHKLIIPILRKNKIVGDIVKSKFNLLFPHHKNLNHNVAHIDLGEPHYSITYYLNDSDGDTIFFKDDLTELQRVKPKENRMVISDGIYHASSNPKNINFRKVLNIVVRKNNEN
jgi:hypothetical protein